MSESIEALILMSLRNQSTTELQIRVARYTGARVQLENSGRGNDFYCGVLNSSIDDCIKVLHERVMFSTLRERGWYYAEWQPQMRYGVPVHSFTLVKNKDLDACLEDMRTRHEAADILARLNEGLKLA